jgi:DNA-3-methyladenine glycosylase
MCLLFYLNVNTQLPQNFYKRDDTLAIARELLGKLLVVPTKSGERVSGAIVETEAYLGTIDKAAHTFGGRRTPRNEITYAAGGHVYVFFVYGMYFQLNFVTGEVDSPQVVLIRAIEPIEGIEIMRERRGPMTDKNLTSGPGKLCIALGIDRTMNGEMLDGERIWVEDRKNPPEIQIASGPRIGINYAEEFIEKPWRFWIKNNQFVSRKS